MHNIARPGVRIDCRDLILGHEQSERNARKDFRLKQALQYALGRYTALNVCVQMATRALRKAGGGLASCIMQPDRMLIITAREGGGQAAVLTLETPNPLTGRKCNCTTAYLLSKNGPEDSEDEHIKRAEKTYRSGSGCLTTAAASRTFARA